MCRVHAATIDHRNSIAPRISKQSSLITAAVKFEISRIPGERPLPCEEGRVNLARAGRMCARTGNTDAPLTRRIARHACRLITDQPRFGPYQRPAKFHVPRGPKASANARRSRVRAQPPIARRKETSVFEGISSCIGCIGSG